MARSSSKTLGAIMQRSRWTLEDAKVVLEAASRSGLPLNGFAAQHEVPPWRIYRWSCRLRKGPSTDGLVGFQEIPVDRADHGMHGEDERIEVLLPSGHAVRVGAQFDEGALRRVLAILDDLAVSC
ncbi:MAG: hypothetical protein ABIE42_03500 [Candidatus Eisenbacteria bacterium]